MQRLPATRVRVAGPRLTRRLCSSSAVRNVGIIAHIDAGKTTTTERMLLLAGVTRFAGSVDTGDTVMDYMQQERDRGITIQSAATRFHWAEHELNLIDTPGHVDFTIEVERAVRVLDGAALIVDAVAGAQAQTETVWRQARRHGTPAVAFVNKMDREGADLSAASASLASRLGLLPLPVQLPLFDAGGFAGVVDLLDLSVMSWRQGGSASKRGDAAQMVKRELEGGAAAHEWGGDGPHEALAASLRSTAMEGLSATLGEAADAEAAAAAAWAARDELVAAVAEAELETPSADEGSGGAVADAYLAGEAVPPEALRAALRRLTVRGCGVPLLCGASLHGVGVEPLLEAIVSYLPAPHERPTPTLRAVAGGGAAAAAAGTEQEEAAVADGGDGDGDTAAAAEEEEEEVVLALDEAAEGVALAFKVVHEGHGRKPLVWLRVYGGAVRRGDGLLNTRVGVVESVAQLVAVHGAHVSAVDSVGAGSLCAALGLKHTRTGDTLLREPRSDVARRAALEGVATPPPVFHCAIETESASQHRQLDEAVAAVRLEDPSVSLSLDPTTGQQLLGGMGELHLQVVVERLRTEWKLPVATGAMRVAHREALTRPVKLESSHAATLGAPPPTDDGEPQIRIALSVEPLEAGEAPTGGGGGGGGGGPGGGGDGLSTACGASGGVRRSLRPSELAAALEGLRAAAQHGDLLGAPLHGARATLLSVRLPRGARPEAVRAAAAAAMGEAMAAGAPRLLEPLMRLEVSTPDAHLGAVMSDLTGVRHGAVQQLLPPSDKAHDTRHTLLAQAPLASLLGYASELRSLSHGEAHLSMEFCGYAPLDAHSEQQRLLEIRGY